MVGALVSGTVLTTSNPSAEENKHEKLAAIQQAANLNMISAAAFSGSVGSVGPEGSRQKLRLSAEGLLDIVTQQVVEGNLTP